MECRICGTEFSYPEYESDKEFGKLIGGTPGCHCDHCSSTVINGTPDDLQRLLDTYFARKSD